MNGPSLDPRPHLPPLERIDFVDLARAFGKRKRLVFGLPLLFAAIAAFGTLAMPNVYRATTKLFPSARSQSSAAAMLNRLGGFAGTTPGAFTIVIPAELYLSMLKSTSVADSLIQRFDLMKGYGSDSLEITRGLLERKTTIFLDKDGLIVIGVEDRNADRAAHLANAYVDELLKVAQRMALTEASHRRLFYERRMRSVKDQLAEAQIEASRELRSRGGARLDDQSQSLVEARARLRARISAKEIELGAMQAFTTVNNQQYTQGQQEIGAMRSELARFENSTSVSQGQVAQADKREQFDKVQGLHDVRYLETLYEMLLKQHEAARIDEANDSSIVAVLDKAVSPQRPIKPNRSFIVMVSAAFGLIIALFFVLLHDVVNIRQRLSEIRKTQS
jgi:capsular polysaccharide biosynthesis protein